MKTYLYNDPIWNDYGEVIGNQVIEITEEEILKQYWNWWCTAMIKKYGLCYSGITKQNCIDDWVMVNWAWLKDGN